MKKLLLLPLVALLSSCSLMYEVRTTQTLIYDEFSKAGFYISPFSEEKGYDYEPVGSHLLLIETNMEWYGSELLKELVNVAISHGANGILNCKVTATTNTYTTTYTLSGDFIRFKGESPVGEINYEELSKIGVRKQEDEMIGDSNYDFAAAKKSGKFYIRTKKGTKYYLDPETKTHISKEKFLKKYTEKDLQAIEKLDKLQ